MKSLLLGNDAESGAEVRIPKSAFSTHFHFIGGTGKGKTTAIHTLLQQLLRDPFDRSAFFIVDRLGNLSQELLLWMASSRFCTDAVRERLLYIQPAREDVVLGFNPLLYDTEAHGYYKVERATEIILRAWESVNIEAMPRLARWTFNAFWAAAQLGLTIADCVHFLMPGSPYHAALLDCLPLRLKAEWQEILSSRSGEVLRVLESTRNRLKPYFESDILRRMFGATTSSMDVLRFMREGRIVLLDLAPRNRLSSQLANTIGALVINEVLATARSLPLSVRYPTYLLLDEFQNFVGPDLEAALPEVRQLGLRLILSHQSFSQLERGDYDLTSMIFQAQSRLIFGLQGEDADLLAHELASLSFDPRRIKDEFYSRRQLVAGHETRHLATWSSSAARAKQWSDSYGEKWGRRTGETRQPGVNSPVTSTADDDGHQRNRTDGESVTDSHSQGGHEVLVPIYDEFLELASRTYTSFDEQRSLWAQQVRRLRTGEALVRLVDDSRLQHVRVKRSTPGFLRHDVQSIARQFPRMIDAMEQLIEQNFRSNVFRSPTHIDRESEKRLEAVLRRPLQLTSGGDLLDISLSSIDPQAPSSGGNPFS